MLSSALALLSIVVAAKAFTPEFAFHAYLFTLPALRLYLPSSIGLRACSRNAADHRRQAQLQYGPRKSPGRRRLLGPSALQSGSTSCSSWPFRFSILISPGSPCRLRPLHTSAVIFAFGGNILIATSIYVGALPPQLAVKFAVVGGSWLQLLHRHSRHGLSLGITQSKEYAEQEWYSDLFLTVVWAVYLLVYLGTIMRRTEPHIYVANWFYLAFMYCGCALGTTSCRCRCSRRNPTSSGRACRTPWCSGGTATTRSAFSSPRASSASCTISSRNAPTGRFLVPPVHHSLRSLVFLYMGRPASPALHGAARLGTDARHDLFDHALDAVMGRHDQRNHDALRCLGQTAHRSGAAHDGGVGGVLRHVDLRRADDVGENRQLVVALHRLDHRSCALRCARLGRLHLIRRTLLPDPLAVESAADSLKLVNWHFWISTSASCSTSARCGCRASCKD